MGRVKLTINPYGDNFMFIDKESGVFLSLTVPTCVIEQHGVTQAIKNSVLSGNIILDEIIEDVEEDLSDIIDTEEITQEPEKTVDDTKKIVKEAKKAKAKSAKK